MHGAYSVISLYFVVEIFSDSTRPKIYYSNIYFGRLHESEIYEIILNEI